MAVVWCWTSVHCGRQDPAAGCVAKRGAWFYLHVWQWVPSIEYQVVGAHDAAKSVGLCLLVPAGQQGSWSLLMQWHGLPGAAYGSHCRHRRTNLAGLCILCLWGPVSACEVAWGSRSHMWHPLQLQEDKASRGLPSMELRVPLCALSQSMEFKGVELHGSFRVRG
jgi:hypothetical protein